MNKIIEKKVNKVSAQDIKNTPEELAKKLIDLVEFSSTDILYEPFRGTGNFYNNFPIENAKIWDEILDNRDFFKSKKNCDWAITNPPWSKITTILDKLVKICNKGFALLVHSMTLSPSRIKFLNENGFSIVKYHMVKVKGWFSHSVFIICKRNCKSIISYDDKVYHMPENESIEYEKNMKEYQQNYYKKNKNL